MTLNESEGRMGVIYKAINLINGKSYIGKTVMKLNQRAFQHKYYSEHPEDKNGETCFCRAIRKYGWNNFKFSTVGIWPVGLLSIFEIHAIKLYETRSPNGYNLTDGGDGSVGHLVSEEARKKIQIKHLGKHLSKETCNKMSLSRTGKKRRPFSEITKQKMRLNGIGRYHNEETKNKISASKKGKSWTQARWNAGNPTKNGRDSNTGRFISGVTNEQKNNQ